jgi:hypothetical protein
MFPIRLRTIAGPDVLHRNKYALRDEWDRYVERIVAKGDGELITGTRLLATRRPKAKGQ